MEIRHGLCFDTLRGINHFEEYVTFDRAIRDKHRDNIADHADIEALCHGMRQSQVNTIMALRNGVVNTIEEITMKPLAPDKQTEDVIIEQKPGLLGMIFGGQQVTRVRR